MPAAYVKALVPSSDHVLLSPSSFSLSLSHGRGLSASIPFILQERVHNYSQQALFSFVTWPFSLKLLWAPIVDGLFFRKVRIRGSAEGGCPCF